MLFGIGKSTLEPFEGRAWDVKTKPFEFFSTRGTIKRIGVCAVRTLDGWKKVNPSVNLHQDNGQKPLINKIVKREEGSQIVCEVGKSLIFE